MGMGNGGREGVAVLLPAGTYRLTQMLEIRQSNVVVRGEGVSCVLQLHWDSSVHKLLPPQKQLLWPRVVHGGCTFNALPCAMVLTRPSVMPCLPACLQVDTTTIYFPKSLQSLYGNKMAWSYMGGFLT